MSKNDSVASGASSPPVYASSAPQLEASSPSAGAAYSEGGEGSLLHPCDFLPLITPEMDQAGCQALLGYAPDWSDSSEYVRAILAAMLVSSDRKFREALLALWHRDEPHASSAAQSNERAV